MWVILLALIQVVAAADNKFSVLYGDCEAIGACFQSPNYPGNYGSNQKCTIRVSHAVQGAKLQVVAFETETNVDVLKIGTIDYNGIWDTRAIQEYSGSIGPNNVVVNTGTEISWRSDPSSEFSGFKICLVNANPREQKSKYFLLTEGICKWKNGDPSQYHNEASFIRTLEECEAAAGRLGLSDTSAYLKVRDRSQDGCSYVNGQLVFSVEYENKPSAQCTSTYNCICKLECPVDMYQDETGQLECKTCETGTSLAGESTCFTPETCPIGMHKSGSSCALCSKGKYQEQTSQTECKACSIGQYQGQTGQATCISCPEGTYQDQTGVNSCKICLEGQTPSVDRTGCVYKQESKYYELNTGFCDSYISSIGECEAAALAMGWSDTTAVTETDATQIPGCYLVSNSYLWFNDASSTAACSSDRPCLCDNTCQPGTYQDEPGQTNCKSCATGKYQNVFGETECKTCQAGQEPTYDRTVCQPIGEQVAACNTDNSDLTDQNTDLTDQNTVLTDQNTVLESQVADLQSQVAACNTDNSELTDQNTDLTDQNTELYDQNTELESNNTALESQVGDCNTDNLGLQEQVAACNTICNTESCSKEQLKQKYLDKVGCGGT